MTITSESPEHTAALGARLGEALEAGDVLALDGDLGAGKTSLVRGIADGLGVPRREVRSPTFILVARHDGGRIPLVHVDAYRLADARGLVELGIDEVLDPGAAAAIEWAPRVAAALPADRLEIAIEHAGPRRRILKLEARGPRSAALLGRFAERNERGL